MMGNQKRIQPILWPLVRVLTVRLPAMLVLVAVAACTVVPFEERHPEIAIHNSSPDCDYQVVDQVTVRDGHDPLFGQSREWATQANMDRAMARLRERAAEAGGDAVILNNRTLGRENGGDLMYIVLNGTAITGCR